MRSTLNGKEGHGEPLGTHKAVLMHELLRRRREA